MSLFAMAFVPPNGQKVPIDITDINLGDEHFFQRQNARISVESVNGQFVVYADLGFIDDGGEPDEAIEISRGRSCKETFAALRVQCEAMIARKE